MTTLTFLIPVRHPANSRDWARTKANLAETARSISAQTNSDWRGLIVANEGSDLPALPPRFDVEWVRFPPNNLHEQAGQSREDFLDAVRFDKGRRVLKGMLRARDSRFVMVVDDDDFISSRIVQYASEHPDGNGWVIDRGYFWSDGGALLQQLDNFNRVCGTSHIIRSDLYGLPNTFEEAASDYIKTMMGSHYRLADSMAEQGAPLASLPFRGAIYRVGQSGSHSLTPGILKLLFLNRQAIRNPGQMLKDLKQLRLVSKAVKQEFFGIAQV